MTDNRVPAPFPRRSSGALACTSPCVTGTLRRQVLGSFMPNALVWGTIRIRPLQPLSQHKGLSCPDSISCLRTVQPPEIETDTFITLPCPARPPVPSLIKPTHRTQPRDPTNRNKKGQRGKEKKNTKVQAADTRPIKRRTRSPACRTQ